MPTYKAYIDQKVTIWQRHHYKVEAESEDEFKKLIKAEAKDLVFYDNGPVKFLESEYLFDTSEDMTFAENGNQPVQEIFDADGNNIE